MFKINYLRSFCFILLACISLLCLQVVYPSVGGTGLVVPVNVAVWFGLACFLFFSLTFILLKRNLDINRGFLIFVVCLLTLVIPLFYTDTVYFDSQLLRFVGLVGGIFFYFCIKQLNLKFNHYLLLGWSALIGIAFQGIFGLVQYYFPELGNQLLGGSNLSLSRPFGSQMQYNIYATLMSLGMALTYFLFPFVKKSRLKLTILFLLLFLCLATLLANSSRIGLLNFATVFLFGTLWLIYSKVKIRKILLFSFIVISSLFSHVLITKAINLSTTGADAAESVKLLRTTRVGTRQTIYPVSWQLFLDEPFKGHGFGTFAYVYLNKQAEYLAKKGTEKVHPYEESLDHPHNEVLYWAVEAGIIGLAFLLVPAIWFISALLKLKVRRVLCILMLLTPLILHNLVELPFYLNTYLFLFFMFVISTVDNKVVVSWRFGKHWLWLLLPIFCIFAYSLDYLRVTKNASDRIMFYGVLKDKQFDKASKLLDNFTRVASFESHFQFYYMQNTLEKYIRSQTLSSEAGLQFMKKYIIWAYAFAQKRPQPSLYVNLIKGLLVLGETEGALEYSNKAKILFPYDETVARQNKKIKKLAQEKDSGKAILKDLNKR